MNTHTLQYITCVRVCGKHIRWRNRREVSPGRRSMSVGDSTDDGITRALCFSLPLRAKLARSSFMSKG